MASIATVATRLPARVRASTAPPRSICEISQPPKMSPFALVSEGIAIVRITISPLGSVAGLGSLIADRLAVPPRSGKPRRAGGPLRRSLFTVGRDPLGRLLRPPRLEMGLKRALQIGLHGPGPE